MQNIFDYIRSQRTEYETTHIPLTEGDEYSQYEVLKQINYYWRNKYLEDAHDDIIGDYPFDNISKYRVLLEARATDFDTKHIEIEPEKPDRVTRVKSMLSTKAVREHMRDITFSAFINDLCITRPKYGGVLCKKTEDGVFVVKWENLITDQSDIMAGIRIERHYLTPSEMLKKKSVWQNVKDALKTAEEHRDKSVAANYDDAQTQGNLIEVYEIQGDIPLSMLKEAQAIRDGKEFTQTEDEIDNDDFEYVEATIIIAGCDWVNKRKDENGNEYDEEDGVVLYANKQKTTHKYLARNPIVGRGLGEGLVESIFEHQKWHNFTKTEEMRMIAIAGKKLYVTDDPDILSNIFDDGVDHGTVLRVSPGKTFTELNQVPTSLPVYQNMRQEWDVSADKTTSSFSAKLGEEAKAGTPFRAQYLQNVEASSQFEQYREEIGIFLQEIVEDWLLPDALKKLVEKDAIYSSFTPQELQLIDDVLVTETVNKELLERTLKGEVVTPEMMMMIGEETRKHLNKQGSKRYVEKIKEFVKDAGGSVVVHTTDEARNKAVYFESLSNTLALLDPADPRRNALIDRIMEAIGISKEELEMYADQQQPMMQQQQNGPAPKLQTKELMKSQMTGGELAMAR